MLANAVCLKALGDAHGPLFALIPDHGLRRGLRLGGVVLGPRRNLSQQDWSLLWAISGTLTSFRHQVVSGQFLQQL